MNLTAFLGLGRLCRFNWTSVESKLSLTEMYQLMQRIVSTSEAWFGVMSRWQPSNKGSLKRLVSLYTEPTRGNNFDAVLYTTLDSILVFPDFAFI